MGLARRSRSEGIKGVVSGARRSSGALVVAAGIVSGDPGDTAR